MSLDSWLKSSEYLPSFMRDFHDQKDVFKWIDRRIKKLDNHYRVSWPQAHVYTIDRFLWFMASRGYTLQKSRKQVEFKEMPDFFADRQEHDAQLGIIPQGD